MAGGRMQRIAESLGLEAADSTFAQDLQATMAGGRMQRIAESLGLEAADSTSAQDRP
jgi:hypothetical protein